MVSDEFKKFREDLIETAKTDYNTALWKACQWTLNRYRGLRSHSLASMREILVEATGKREGEVELDLLKKFLHVPFSAKYYKDHPEDIRENYELTSYMGTEK